MGQCVICGKPSGFLNFSKCREGSVCRDCLNKIPVGTRIRSMTVSELKPIIKKAEDKSSAFTATAHLGGLYLDGTSRMVCIAPNENGEQPRRISNIYRIDEITGISLNCSNPKNAAQNNNAVRIVCDIEVTMKTITGECIKTVVQRGVQCNYKRIGDKVQVEEPAILPMFRTMFNQMVEDETYALVKRMNEFREQLKKLENPENMWAKGVLLLSEPFDENDVREQARRMKELHDGNSEAIDMIRKAENILSSDTETD